MKPGKKFLILALSLVLATSLISCDLLNTTDPTIVEEIKVSKPEFSEALANYDALSAKSSDFDGKIVFTIYGNTNATTGVINTYSLGQHLTLKRIENNSKIYIDGAFESCDLSDNMSSLITLVKNHIEEVLSGEEYVTADKVLGYLDGTYNAEIDLGYDGVSTYNVKGKTGSDSDSENIYVATNDEYINNQLVSKLINSEIKVSDYLMYSTFVNFSDTANWISEDTASKFYDNAVAVYQMAANNEKIYNYIFGLLQNYIGCLDVNAYAVDIQKYTECINYIKNWVSIGESSVTATVNKDNLPLSMDTSVRVNININRAELKTVVYTLIGDNVKADKIWSDSIDILLRTMFKGINGESGYIGITVDISFSEKYSYDEESVSLENVDKDLFVDAKELVDGRVAYILTETEPEANTDSEDEASDGYNAE